MITIGGQLLLTLGDQSCQVLPGVITLADGVIVRVDLEAPPAASHVGGDDYFVAPGMIDAHLHLPQFDIVGAHGMPLLRWLDEVVFPAEAKWAESEFATQMVRRVAGQLLSVGTTAIAAYATSHHESTFAALTTMRDMGIAGCIGLVGMDREAPDQLLRPHDAFANDTADLLSRFPPGSRMSAAITPRFAISCSEDLLRAAGDLAKQSGAIVQTHLAETVAECQRVSELFDGRPYVDVYRDTGLLTDRSVLGHGIHLGDADREQLASAGSLIAHCPTANSFLRSGAMNRDEHLEAGMRVVLGSDIGAGYERSMVRVARAMIQTAATLGDDYPSAAAAWYAITTGGADALDWPTLGRIAEGASADVVVCRPDIGWRTEGISSLSQLMFAWDDRWIKKVFLQSRLAFDNH